jgi:hypothetical protein
MANPYTLTDPANARVAKRYLSWLRTARDALGEGRRVYTNWSTVHKAPESFQAELRRAIDTRINLRGGEAPKGRKDSLDYEAQARRDQGRIHDKLRRRARVYQFETAEARRRYGHLLSSYGED